METREKVEKVRSFLADLRELCRKHEATIVGCLTCETPTRSVGSVAGVEVVSLGASERAAVGTIRVGNGHLDLTA